MSYVWTDLTETVQVFIRKMQVLSFVRLDHIPSLRCSVEEMRKCTSIHQRLKMSPDERLEMYVHENDIVDLEPNVVGGSEDEDEEEVDDTNESEGDEIDITTFPDCGFVQPFLAPEREGTARVEKRRDGKLS